MQRGTFKVSKQGEIYNPRISLKIMNFYFKELEMKLSVQFQNLWLAISHETDPFIFYFWFAEMLFLRSF